MTLNALAKHVSISKRTLEKYLADPDHPLPLFRLPGGRIRLVRLSDFDAWLSAYRDEAGSPPQLQQTVSDILSRLDSRASK